MSLLAHWRRFFVSGTRTKIDLNDMEKGEALFTKEVNKMKNIISWRDQMT